MKLLYFFLFVLLLPTLVFAQGNEFVPSGKAFALIFANFHWGITGSATDEAAFELNRAYIGYEYTFSPEFYAKINVDVGSPNDLSPLSKIRRYAYFKNAFLRYTQKKAEFEFGLISLKQFKLQEDIWERRYLMEVLADEYNFGASADLGANFHYKFSKTIDADFTIMNGEGYTSLQMDDIFKYSVGSTIRLPRNFTSRVVYDWMRNGNSETNFLIFTSYDFRNIWNLAAEYIIRRNSGYVENQDIQGFSVYGKYNINPKFQLFARYDIVESSVLEGETNPWNLAKDGTALVGGVQFSPIKNIKMALNYHDWYSRAGNIEGRGFIYFDLEVKM
jgi:hypothetical protein